VPKSPLEAQVREFWDACHALKRQRNRAARLLPPPIGWADAVEVLKRLSMGQAGTRLRLAAGDRLMSLAPASAASAFARDRPMDF
jgi:hypothetical protein